MNTFLTILLFLGAGVAVAEVHINGGNPTYYICRDGKTLEPEYGDPKQAAPDHWQIWLYRKTTGGIWGMIDGKTSTSVSAQLIGAQKFERQYNKWCGCGDNDQLTYTKPKGPIAIMRETEKGASALFEKAESAHASYEALRDELEGLENLSGDESSQKALSGSSNLMEYLKSVKEIGERVAKVKNSITDMHAWEFKSIDGELKKLTQDEDRETKLAPGILSSFGSAKDFSWTFNADGYPHKQTAQLLPGGTLVLNSKFTVYLSLVESVSLYGPITSMYYSTDTLYYVDLTGRRLSSGPKWLRDSIGFVPEDGGITKRESEASLLFSDLSLAHSCAAAIIAKCHILTDSLHDIDNMKAEIWMLDTK